MARNPFVYSIMMVEAVLASGDNAGVVVPDGYRWVVRDLDGYFSPAPGGPGYVGLLVNPAGTSDTIYIGVWRFARGVGGQARWRGRQVIEAGGGLTVEVAGNGIPSGFQVSGYQLTLP